MTTTQLPAQRRRHRAVTARVSAVGAEFTGLLSCSQVADALGLARQTVRNLMVVAKPGEPTPANRLRAMRHPTTGLLFCDPGEVARFKLVPRPPVRPWPGKASRPDA